jgi:hypothetical protein
MSNRSWRNDADWEGNEEEEEDAEGNPWAVGDDDDENGLDRDVPAKAKAGRVTSAEWQKVGTALEEINPYGGDSDSSSEKKGGGARRSKASTMIVSKTGGGKTPTYSFHSSSPVNPRAKLLGNPFGEEDEVEDSNEDRDADSSPTATERAGRPGKGISVSADVHSPLKANGRRSGTPSPTNAANFSADSPGKRSPVAKAGASTAPSPSSLKAVAIASMKSTSALKVANKLAYRKALRSLMLMGYRQSYASAALVHADIQGSEPLFCAFALRELKKVPGGTGVDHNIWRPVLNARVTSWMPETDEDGSTHTAYTIRCFLDVPSHSSWHIALRYSRLKELNAELNRRDSSGARDPKAAPFPSSGRGLGLMADTDQRKTVLRGALDAWLRDVLFDVALAGHPATSAAIFAALDVMKHVKFGGAAAV